MKKRKEPKYYRTNYERMADEFPFRLLLGVIFFGGIWLIQQIVEYFK